MATTMLILGQPGSGKTTSLENLDPKETCIINVTDKPLSLPLANQNYGKMLSEGGNYASAVDGPTIVKILQYIDAERPEFKNIVLDDFQYIMSDEFMQKAMKKGYDKFNEIAKHAYDVINFGIKMENRNFIVLSHSDYDDKRDRYKIKTIGRMLDDKIALEGLFTIVLYSIADYDRKEKKGVYNFVTNMYSNGQGIIPAKSPRGMFDETLIPNDLGFVLTKIKEYYG